MADSLGDLLSAEGLAIARVSSGQVFREIARKETKTIDELVREITLDREKAEKIDVGIDMKIKEEIRRELRKGKTVLVDSAIAPFSTRGITVLVKTAPEVAARRIYKARRMSDKPFGDPGEAEKELFKRTERDLERYRNLSMNMNVPPEWRKIYKKAVRNWGEEEIFDIVINNSGTLEESLKQLIKALVIRI